MMQPVNQHDAQSSPTGDVLLHPEEAGVPAKRSKWRLALDIGGLLLFVGAVWYALGSADWTALRRANPIDFVWLVAWGVAAIGCSAVLFMIINRPLERTRPITLLEWVALLLASSLLNYFMKAGLVGRVAYMKRRHGIGIAGNSATMVVYAAATTGLYIAIILLTAWRRELEGLWWTGMVAAMLIGSAMLAPFVRMIHRKWGNGVYDGLVAWIFLCFIIRLADVFCFAARFMIAAKVLGHDMDLSLALLVGTVTNFVTLAMPVNLGVRDIFSAALLGWVGSGMSPQDATAVVVIDRAAEVVVFVIGGLASLFVLHRKMTRGLHAQAA